MTTPARKPTPTASAPRAWLGNLIVLGLTTLLCLAVLEAAGQWRRPALPPRALFFSENPWVFDDRGFLHFAPSRTLRSVAVYGDQLEYDVEFRTNALGFIDDVEYGPGGGRERRIAVVGDSFTAGYHGGRAWVPTLRTAPGFDPARHALFNFGVSGTGLPNFEGILAAHAPALDVDEILIVAIANDFERPLIRAPSTAGGIVLCDARWSEERCLGQRTQIFTLPPDATPESVLASARASWAERKGSLFGRIRHQSFLVHLARRWLGGGASASEPDFAALAAIRARAPEARLAVLQVPEKADVLNETFVSLREQIEAAGARYHDGAALCRLGGADFLPNDSHPNASGYRKLRDCVAGVLELGAPTP